MRFFKTPQGESREQANLPRPKPRRFLQRFAPLLLGVPRTSCGSGYILGAVVITSFAARRLKPSPRSPPQGVTIPNAFLLPSAPLNVNGISRVTSSLFRFPHIKNSEAAKIPHLKFWVAQHLVCFREHKFFISIHSR